MNRSQPSTDAITELVVKFHDWVELPYEDGVERQFERLGIDSWSNFSERYPGATFRRALRSLEHERLQRLVVEAQDRDPTYDPPNLLGYFLLRVAAPAAAEEVIAALLTWPTVEAAYRLPRVDLAAVDPSDDPGRVQQGYLNPAPQGIGVGCAWAIDPGGDGKGIRFVDMEFGWTFNHEDLDAHGITLIHGTIDPWSASHGTAVLGEVCAIDNALGCIGIAPGVSSVGTTSAINSSPWDAILAALPTLDFGDVLLLELQITFSMGGHQWNNIVLEAYPLVFDAVRLATALGVVVVQCAGNGANDLDIFQDGAGNNVLDRNDPNFQDSGAIVVGAGSASVAHFRLAFSNHGNRVDCYAWGNSVYTCASNSAGATNLYTGGFNGTSSAGPIVAGAAILVQSIGQAQLGYRFSPTQLRALLGDPANGTASANPPVDRIGVMPNMCLLVDQALFVAPDIYLRDFVGDPGDPHGVSVTYASPDVIPRQTPVPNPQAAYGAGSGTESLGPLGDLVEAGQDNYLYVRVLNRGGSDASNVTVTVYWSHGSTLVTPANWTLIGSDTIPLVPNGNVLTVSNEIVWPAAAIPGPGHYCFVALIGTASDPAPGPASFPTWNDYVLFVQNNNNVAWRNFDVVDLAADASTEMPFLMAGAHDAAHPMRLEVMARLPQGSRLLLELPVELLGLLHDRTPYADVDPKRRVARVPMNPYGLTRSREVPLAPRSRVPMRLLVDVPEKRRQNAYEVFARQTYQEQEVGRMTWRLT